MNFKLIINTLIHLKPIQAAFQVKNRVVKKKYIAHEFCGSCCTDWMLEPIPRQKCTKEDEFLFINIPSKFTSWNDASRGMLWTYNQNYFDFINQETSTKEYGIYWIDKFIEELPSNKVGLDPYPIALRGINWIKFFGRYPETMTKERIDCLYSQYKLLQKKLEYHLLGNHLLEDFYSLFIMSLFFEDTKYHQWVTRKLIDELDEEILNDGGHYEQSVMYHCILLDRLLDCINFASGSKDSLKGLEGLDMLKQYAISMLGWLDSMCYEDGSCPMFNDAALCIAPTSAQIFEYAMRLGLSWRKASLCASGYRKMHIGNVEAFIDCGNITATYQPGHTHADALNYELHIDGKPVAVDTGISTYNKTARRQYERSTIAHNCVVCEDATTDSNHSCYEVWGGFRVGKRCKTVILKDTITEITAQHDGYGSPCKRTWRIEDGAFVVEDCFEGNAISIVHLAEGISPDRIKVIGSVRIEVEDEDYSTEYNRFHKGKVIKIHFNGMCRYVIK